MLIGFQRVSQLGENSDEAGSRGFSERRATLSRLFLIYTRRQWMGALFGGLAALAFLAYAWASING